MKVWLLALALFMASVGAAQAATVYLKDGGVLTGTVVSSTADDLHLAVAGGTLIIPAVKILRVDYADSGAPPTQPQQPPVMEPPAEYPTEPRRYYREPPDLLERNQELSIDLGFIVPTSNVDFSCAGCGSDSNGNSGGLFGFQYLYFPAPRIGWGLSVDFFNRGRTQSQNFIPGSETNVSGDTTLLMAMMKCMLTTEGPVRPYLLAGVGMHNTSTVVDSTPDGPGPTQRLVDASAWGPAGAIKLGLDFHYLGPYVLGLEAGWIVTDKANYGPTAAGQDWMPSLSGVSTSVDVFSLAFRWGFRF